MIIIISVHLLKERSWCLGEHIIKQMGQILIMLFFQIATTISSSFPRSACCCCHCCCCCCCCRCFDCPFCCLQCRKFQQRGQAGLNTNNNHNNKNNNKSAPMTKNEGQPTKRTLESSLVVERVRSLARTISKDFVTHRGETSTEKENFPYPLVTIDSNLIILSPPTIITKCNLQRYLNSGI